MKTISYKIPLFILLILCTLSKCYSQVYVKSDASGLNNGTSWQNAYKELSTAINNTTNGQIWVASGTYKPLTDLAGNVPANSKLKTFRLKERVAIYGGFAGNESMLAQRDWNKNLTVLSGDIGVAKDSSDNCLHVVSAEYAKLDTTTVLDGVVVKDGYGYHETGGAGIYIFATSGGKFILRNCVIENNRSFREGGGLYIFDCHPIIENNTFRNNQSFRGGAIFLSYSNAVVRNNKIIANRAYNYPNVASSSLSGGGIYVNIYSSPTITANLIQDNIAGIEGGGIAIRDNYHTIFTNNQIIGNKSINGGGLFLATGTDLYLFNNVFAKNTATEYGGAIHMNYAGGSQFINNTITANTAGRSGGGLFLYAINVDITNTILHGNTCPDGPQAKIITLRTDWLPKFRFCNIEKGRQGIVNDQEIVYLNNRDTPPMFQNSAKNNFNILAKSPMIDAGTLDPTIIKSPWKGSNNEVIAFPAVDITGNPRVYNGIIDIGAFESRAKEYLPPTDITLSNSKISPADKAGTFIGTFSTVDPDSKSFTYALVTIDNCFVIRNDSLFTNCAFSSASVFPVALTVQSADEQGWTVEKTIKIESIITSLLPESKTFYVYPNPSGGVVTIEGDLPKACKVDVFAITGELVHSTVLENTKRLDLSKLPIGIYELVIGLPGQFYRSRLIKQ